MDLRLIKNLMSSHLEHIGYAILLLDAEVDDEMIDNKTNLNVVNYSLGFTYTDLVDHILFASYATSFETPTLNELSANPFGEEGFNPDLSSAQARNFELGWRYNSFFGQLETTIYYIINSRDTHGTAWPHRDG